MCQWDGSASVGGVPGHASVNIPQAHLGLFSLATAAFAAFPGEGKSILGLVSPGLRTWPTSLCLMRLAKAGLKASSAFKTGKTDPTSA